MAQFENAIGRVLENEGGYCNDPDDPGGETNFGICKRSYPNLDIKNLTKDDAIAVYRRDFWRFSGINDQQVATKVFDTYVNMRHDAIKLAQEILGITQDGLYGRNTEYTLNQQDPQVFLRLYRARLVKHYELIVQAHPEEAKFLEGWKRRANQ
jgi:lysozyme family protein